MQHLHQSNHGSHTGAGAKFFGDRRVRHPNNNNNNNNNHYNHHHHLVALKCPRCESINTKFCYYNNYNLSQPRHFCKNCRRYWTKGGVLRNVPVGGGCRKPTKKRSSSSSTRITNKKLTTIHMINSNSNSNSDHETSNVGPNNILVSQHHQNNLECLFSGSSDGIQPLIGVPPTVDISSDNDNDMLMMFGGFDMGSDNQGEGGIDPTVTIDDLLQSRGSNGELATLDWHDHQGLFDQTTNDSNWGQMTLSHHPFPLKSINNNNDNNNNNNTTYNYNNNYNIINNDDNLFLP